MVTSCTQLESEKFVLEKGYRSRSSRSVGINSPNEKQKPPSEAAEHCHGKIVLLHCANSCFNKLCISKFWDSLLSNSAFAFRVLLWVSRLIELKG